MGDRKSDIDGRPAPPPATGRETQAPRQGGAGPLLHRRDLIRLGIASAAGLLVPGGLPRAAEALATRANNLVFALLDHGPGSNPRPTALRRMAWELTRRTSIAAELETIHVRPEDPRLFYLPFMVLAGQDAFELPSDAGVANLRRHLTYGGTLLIDSTEGGPGSPFDRSARRLVEEVLPGRPLRPIPRDHVLYKSFYLMDAPSGRVMRRPYLEGVSTDDRWAVVYSQNDLLGAWARDDLGMWEMEVEQRQRELAFRLGVNLVVYALCLDYKEDQVHIPFILQRRRG